MTESWLVEERDMVDAVAGLVVAASLSLRMREIELDNLSNSGFLHIPEMTRTATSRSKAVSGILAGQPAV